jgi:hypothetical protein
MSNLTSVSISEDAISWGNLQEYWHEKKAARKAAMNARIAAIPEVTSGRCALMELATETRQQILSYVLEWQDVRCIEVICTDLKKMGKSPTKQSALCIPSIATSFHA